MCAGFISDTVNFLKHHYSGVVITEVRIHTHTFSYSSSKKLIAQNLEQFRAS